MLRCYSLMEVVLAIGAGDVYGYRTSPRYGEGAQKLLAIWTRSACFLDCHYIVSLNDTVNVRL